MNIFSTAALVVAFIISFIIVMIAAVSFIYSENMKCFFMASIYALITIIFLGAVVIILPKTEKLISSTKCMNYDSAYQNVEDRFQGDSQEKTFRVRMIEDSNCETSYVEVRNIVIVLEVLPVFEVRNTTEYVLHMRK